MTTVGSTPVEPPMPWARPRANPACSAYSVRTSSIMSHNTGYDRKGLGELKGVHLSNDKNNFQYGAKYEIKKNQAVL